MTVRNEQLVRIQQQFRRQADAYERLASVSEMEAQRRLAAALSGATREERALDVACGPAGPRKGASNGCEPGTDRAGVL